MSDTDLIQVLRCRIRELEDKVDALRISRRVLMNLVDTLDREKREQIHKLQILNEKLQKNNCRYARAIMFRNVRITELETEVDQKNRINSRELDKLKLTIEATDGDSTPPVASEESPLIEVGVIRIGYNT